MSKQYRAELRDLKRAQKKVANDLHRCLAANQEIKRCADRDSAKADRAASKAIVRIKRRIAILEGRLS